MSSECFSQILFNAGHLSCSEWDWDFLILKEKGKKIAVCNKIRAFNFSHQPASLHLRELHNLYASYWSHWNQA